jgi:hypothetical protein
MVELAGPEGEWVWDGCEETEEPREEEEATFGGKAAGPWREGERLA